MSFCFKQHSVIFNEPILSELYALTSDINVVVKIRISLVVLIIKFKSIFKKLFINLSLNTKIVMKITQTLFLIFQTINLIK